MYACKAARKPGSAAVDDDAAAIDPRLVLFAAFVVRTLAQDADAGMTAMVSG